MTGELLHQSTLPVLPDIEASDIETPVVKDICMNYDGKMDLFVASTPKERTQSWKTTLYVNHIKTV